MALQEKLRRLKVLDSEAEAIRKSLGISGKDETIYKADLNTVDDDLVLVIADGYGGARLCVVTGNFPIDYNEEHGRDYESEDTALGQANELVNGAEIEDIFKGNPNVAEIQTDEDHKIS